MRNRWPLRSWVNLHPSPSKTLYLSFFYLVQQLYARCMKRFPAPVLRAHIECVLPSDGLRGNTHDFDVIVFIVNGGRRSFLDIDDIPCTLFPWRCFHRAQDNGRRHPGKSVRNQTQGYDLFSQRKPGVKVLEIGVIAREEHGRRKWCMPFSTGCIRLFTSTETVARAADYGHAPPVVCRLYWGRRVRAQLTGRGVDWGAS